MSSSNRRRFMAQTAAAGAAPLIIGTKSSAQVKGANDRLRIAVAGLNGRGGSHIGGFGGIKGVEIAYVADPDANVRGRRLKEVQGKGHKNCKAVADIREALEDSEVDAISVAAPNHWHSLMTIWGAQAGKHV
ncbi:MAG TPA: dehydrogenase, partial [Verrucomicrobiales bacterium]|nr:dehydrogenase [Verrucomicrobiales bacterium]